VTRTLALTACLLLAASPVHASGWHVAAVLPWYGPGFYGHRTACGQLMDKWLIGVASRTLPCGSLVTLSYRGRTRTVPVVDRGPWPPKSERRSMPFDATARLAIKLTGHPPYTAHDVLWRRGR
jgi:Lytic transglycolase